MINNLMMGADEYPCYCTHNNLFQGSITKVTPDLEYADLITCTKCNFKFYSNRKGIECPKCNSSLVQGSKNRDKIVELNRVLNFPFTEIPLNIPPVQ
jgi:uncharacterized CHY-type Zn-finger protein